MPNLLTLAITETFPGTDDFNVIALDEKSRNLIALHLKKEDIISEDGKVYWDIGRWTEVSKLQLTKLDTDPRNRVYIPESSILHDKANIKSILEDRTTSSREFMANRGSPYAILKVKKTNEIVVETDEKGILRCRLAVQFYDNPAHPQRLLNKDYRWVKYWSKVPKEEMTEVKDQYFKLLNRPSKTLYLIVYRHYFKDSACPVPWIVGMHWL